MLRETNKREDAAVPIKGESILYKTDGSNKYGAQHCNHLEKLETQLFAHWYVTLWFAQI